MNSEFWVWVSIGGKIGAGWFFYYNVKRVDRVRDLDGGLGLWYKESGLGLY